MHPALSVIFFTVMSGTAYGSMILLGVALALAPREFDAGAVAFALGLAGVFAAAGLCASMLHLGQPQRAWRAFSQWRTSWLSREGVAAVATFVPLALAFVLVSRADEGAALRSAGLALAAGALLTLYCTAHIYRSLQTVAAWHNGYVLPGYLLYAVLGGGSVLWAIAAAVPDGLPYAAHVALIAVVFLASRACALLKRSYWNWLDGAAAAPDATRATGLGRFGSVRSVEAPHTEENYLTQEMGFRLARKHAARLRRVGLALGATLPAFAALIGLFLLQHAVLELALALCAAAAALAGAFVERWLFFAEAKHAVMAYYQGAAPADNV